MYIASSGTLVRADAPAATARTDSKLVQLEALRGLAAFIVVAWHFLWAFDPARIGIVDGFDPSSAMLGSVSFASIDGPAAVTLFFVLSGFVLPLGFFRSGRTELVVRATAKRWLRLVCLVMLAVLLSWLLFRFGLYRHREAAQISQSAWLGTFGGSHPWKASHRRCSAPCWKVRCSHSSASRTCTIRCCGPCTTNSSAASSRSSLR